MTAPAGAGRALVPFVPPARGSSGWLRAAALVALFGLTAGAGAGATYLMRHSLQRWGTDPALETAVRGTREQVARLSAEVAKIRAAGDPAKPDDATRTLRRAVDALRADIEQLRASTVAAGTQTASRLDKLERDPAGRIADLAARLDRVEHDAKADRPPVSDTARAAVAHVGSDKEPVGAIPQPVASAEPVKAAGPAKPVEVAAAKAPVVPAKLPVVAAAKLPATAPAVPVARPGAATLAPRSETTAVPAATAAAAPVRGWVLRDVYDGLALVEAQGGEIREIGPGEYLPGAGEIRSIQRRGRSWVVLTSRGVIETAAYDRGAGLAGSPGRVSSW